MATGTKLRKKVGRQLDKHLTACHFVSSPTHAKAGKDGAKSMGGLAAADFSPLVLVYIAILHAFSYFMSYN